MHHLYSVVSCSAMMGSSSRLSWRQFRRMSVLTSRRLTSSSGPSPAGAQIVPCEAVDTTSDKETEEEASVSSVSSPSSPELPRLGRSGRKALLNAAMGLNSTSKTNVKSVQQTLTLETGLKGPNTKLSKKKLELLAPTGSTEIFSGDLQVVLGVARDDEAARMIPHLSLHQKMRVLSTLTARRRRSVPLLRAVAASVTTNSEKLDLKAAADVLYAAATLNFLDDPLLERAATDAGAALAAGQGNGQGRLAVVRSIAVSLGMLRYRDVELLDRLSEWLISQLPIVRPQEVTALLLTLAAVHYLPSNADDLFQVLLPRLNERYFPSASAWLDSVWALAVLGQALPEHAASVLSPEFISRLARTTGNAGVVGELAVGPRLKLLNVNAVSQYLIPSYKGPLLQASSEVSSVPLGRTKEKQSLVKSVLDALGNLLPSSNYLRSDVNTGMGFLLDAECLIDSKCNPLPFAANKPQSQRVPEKKSTKVAVMVWGYSDVCRGRGSPPPLSGPAVLAEQLLVARGYQILRVHHAEFGDAGSGLVHRVQFLERRLKQLAAATVAHS